ncbi:hypothetical protein [Roseateles sp.]|uniref:hypothetical protein n=1 Tax=Roseateles sp. TaxID=1971397 RepID=UPI003BA6EFCA
MGVLRMPIDYVGGPLSPMSPMSQLVARAREAADRIESDAAEILRLRAKLAAAVADERERCAKICEAQEYSYWRASEDQDFTPQDCADAIRRA